MKKIFFESDKHFQKRCDFHIATALVQNKKLWRIKAIQIKQVNNGFQMLNEDHFTVEAYCKELAIGIFKMANMNWFVIGIEEENVIS